MHGKELLRALCADERDISLQTLEQVLYLAAQIAREGRKIGTIFVVADTEAVLRHSTSLILDPLALHPEHQKRLDDPNLRGTVKALAQLDGAFIVSNEGVVLAAC